LSNVGPNDVIESWEWEIDALTPGYTYHHPTNDWVDRFTAYVQFGESIENTYSLYEYQPGYLIDGPFSKMTGIYAKFLANDCCQRMTSIGNYDLYKVLNKSETGN
jgi:hypothetical protein